MNSNPAEGVRELAAQIAQNGHTQTISITLGHIAVEHMCRVYGPQWVDALAGVNFNGSKIFVLRNLDDGGAELAYTSPVRGFTQSPAAAPKKRKPKPYYRKDRY